MKIRCGSHQQNRSIVRPGLSLMATKVALTAEEFRENSQRSIDLFNTEKLSTNSTHVLKSAYCNSVHFCRCNLHGACGGKVFADCNPVHRESLQSARGVWRQSSHGARRSMQAKTLQSARGVWRQSRCGKCTARRRPMLQSARGVWRQSKRVYNIVNLANGCNLHGACGGKEFARMRYLEGKSCNLHGACGGKERLPRRSAPQRQLQSARGVWRQSSISSRT